MKMNAAVCLTWLACVAGCATNDGVVGTYAPSCVAFEGNTIELADSRFTWDKFTDEVTVDDAGNTVDPFPGFPVRGTYTVEGDVVRLVTDVGELAAELHFVRRPGQVYLLTDAEFDAWRNSGTVPKCALLLGAGE
ncbi:MAG TPA: hypothetical protein VK854_05635 [Woeseiaceae bacterium]|nr:hypothetical protein [Woeseiaceae bacterium]